MVRNNTLPLAPCDVNGSFHIFTSTLLKLRAYSRGSHHKRAFNIAYIKPLKIDPFADGDDFISVYAVQCTSNANHTFPTYLPIDPLQRCGFQIKIRRSLRENDFRTFNRLQQWVTLLRSSGTAT